jgi:hypothetical protein
MIAAISMILSMPRLSPVIFGKHMKTLVNYLTVDPNESRIWRVSFFHFELSAVKRDGMEFAKRSLVASETAMKGGSTAVRLKQRQQATFHDLFQISIRSSENDGLRKH